MCNKEKVKYEAEYIKYKQPKRQIICWKTQLWFVFNHFISLKDFFNCKQRFNLIIIWMFETLWYNKSPWITCLLNRFPSLSKYIIDQFGHWFRSTGSSLLFEFEVCQDVLDNSDKHNFYLQRLLCCRQFTELAVVLQCQLLPFFPANLSHMTEVLLVTNQKHCWFQSSETQIHNSLTRLNYQFLFLLNRLMSKRIMDQNRKKYCACVIYSICVWMIHISIFVKTYSK